MAYTNIREEELKNKIAKDYFGVFDCTKIIGNIDFCVTIPLKNKKQESLFETESLLWGEAKSGKSDIYKSLTQLIITIGKARTFDRNLPPAYLGAFDAEKIAFISYNDIHDVFYITDFNWNITPSDYSTKEFILVLERVHKIIENNYLLYYYEENDKEIKDFIKTNFITGKSSTSKVKIDKNNFIVIYNKWLSAVKPTISFNWSLAKSKGIIDGDFYLADLLSSENVSLKESLYVVLKTKSYELNKHKDEYGAFASSHVGFIDSQKAHTLFWNKYERPPKEEYWDYIIERRDLLVPQDIRERKGSFFTPQIWVELSQKYLTDVLGENWQDEYYVWDCAAGTGNLLTGLTNKYNVWASTLDSQDVDVIKDRIANGANLLQEHVFQFDFLNDDFSKLPKGLQNIINDPTKREKLVIYINPPYAEAGDTKQRTGSGKNKESVASETKVYKDNSKIIGTAMRELFAQFFIRIYKEIPDSILAQFSTLKIIQSQNFLKLRNVFKAEFKKGFLVPANSFDNVKGQFPVGFFIWDLKQKDDLKTIECDVFYKDETPLNKKTIYTYEKGYFIIDWIRKYFDKKDEVIGYLRVNGPDMQNNIGVFLTNYPTPNDIEKHFLFNITKNNIVEMSIYFAVRHCVEANWLNDRDQYLHPNEGWKNDIEFQNDCFAYTLFDGQNKVTVKSEKKNHWIPFSEQEINAKEKFESNLMSQFIKGKIKQEKTDLFSSNHSSENPFIFSKEAVSVFMSGLSLWKYYHTQSDINVNASLYNIREYFQGRNEKGKMNNKSADEHYMSRITDLRNNLRILEKKIEPKVFEYGFLKS